MSTLIDSEAAPLMMSGEQNGQRVVLIPFDLRQSNLPLAIAYGVTHKDAAAKIDAEVLQDLPTAPDNLAAAIELDTEFWVENVEPLTERFTAWEMWRRAS